TVFAAIHFGHCLVVDVDLPIGLRCARDVLGLIRQILLRISILSIRSELADDGRRFIELLMLQQIMRSRELHSKRRRPQRIRDLWIPRSLELFEQRAGFLAITSAPIKRKEMHAVVETAGKNLMRFLQGGDAV